MSHCAQVLRQNAAAFWKPPTLESQAAEAGVLGLGVLRARPALPVDYSFYSFIGTCLPLGCWRNSSSASVLSPTPKKNLREKTRWLMYIIHCCVQYVGPEGTVMKRFQAWHSLEDFSGETLCCGLQSPQSLLEQFGLAQTMRMTIAISPLIHSLRSLCYDHSS